LFLALQGSALWPYNCPTASATGRRKHPRPPLRPDPQPQPGMAALWERKARRYRDFEHLKPKFEPATATKMLVTATAPPAGSFAASTSITGATAGWVPKDLRTSFVSMMSYQGVPVEEIAGSAGHASARTTEVIHRRELRPVITTGAEVMDRIVRPKQPRGKHCRCEAWTDHASSVAGDKAGHQYQERSGAICPV
jgi:hypothetical protein